MGEKLEGDATLDVLAFFARERRRIGMDASFRVDPAIVNGWLDHVESHPTAMDGETVKNEGGPTDGWE